MRISHFTAGSSTEQVIWTNPGLGYRQSDNGHLGASLNIGPDGKLYLSLGDQFLGRAQDRTNIWGKILRLNLDGTIPADNPFRDGTGPNMDEIWAYGLRNPFRASFDEATGRYWIGDVGGNVAAQAYEEVNIGEVGQELRMALVRRTARKPKNGPTCPSGVTAPVHSYAHTTATGATVNKSIVGGEIYRGSMFPLAGAYIYADYATNRFSWVRLGRGRTHGHCVRATAREVGVDSRVAQCRARGRCLLPEPRPDGTGQLRKLTYSGASDRPPVISTASATPTTGCAHPRR